MTYSNLQITYHWLTAAAIAAMAASGLAYTYDWVEGDSIAFHQIVGQILIVLLVARIIARLTSPPRHATVQHARWEQIIALVVHIGLYLCMVAYVVTGYVSASGLRDPLLIAPVNQAFARSDTGELILEAHFAIKWVLLGLVSLHIAGVIKHRFWDKDTTLSNMTPTFRKE